MYWNVREAKGVIEEPNELFEAVFVSPVLYLERPQLRREAKSVGLRQLKRRGPESRAQCGLGVAGRDWARQHT